MDIIDEKIEEYAENHSSPESNVLYELNRQTNLKVVNSRMLSGHLQGRLLSMISKMVKPNYILEIGTYTGYSALCLAEGLSENGKLITIDKNIELAEMVKKYIQKAKLSPVIEPIIGDAMQIIPTLEKNFDLVFIDADKSNYSNYYDLIINDLPKGAIIIADNVLWSGKVIQPIKKNDVDTLALQEFNAKIHADNRVENLLLPIRDGLMIVRKK